MVLGTVIRYGIPFSFVYCTIYQQDIWREGDEKLVLEQKRTWRNFFNMIDCGYSTLDKKLNIFQDSASPSSNYRLNLVTKYDALNVKQCWNAKVMSAFSKMNESSVSKLLDFSQWTSPPSPELK